MQQDILYNQSADGNLHQIDKWILKKRVTDLLDGVLGLMMEDQNLVPMVVP
jgi:hypothetical protein